MPDPHTEVSLYGIRKYCDFCKGIAEYDGKTKFGGWAYMCEIHYHFYGVGLGLGRGQKIIYRDDPND